MKNSNTPKRSKKSSDRTRTAGDRPKKPTRARKKTSDDETRGSAEEQDRRRKRADRNRMRTVKHVHKLLDQYVAGVVNGYEHHGWVETASCVRQLSPFLAPEEYNAIAEVWRNTWTQEISVIQIEQLVSMIKERIAGNAFSELMSY